MDRSPFYTMDDFDFNGIVLSIYNGGIYNTQIPLMLDASGNNIVLKGHMARANMKWSIMKLWL